MKHTPGPWRVTVFTKDYGASIMTGTNHPVATVTLQRNANEHDANAQLIAAAPDLLEACKLLMTFNIADVIASAGGTPYSEKIEWFDFVHLVERAVAKGESKT